MNHASLPLLALTVIGCESTEIARLELDGVDFEIGFLVAVTGPGRPSRISPTFERSTVERTPDALPAFELMGDEARAILCGFRREHLGDALSAAELIASSVAARIEAPPSEPVGSARDYRRQVDFAIPTGAIFIDDRGSGDPGQLREQITISAELAPEAPEEMEPFGSTGYLLRDTAGFPDYVAESTKLRAAAWLDRDHALVASDFFLMLVERGQPAPRGPYDPARPSRLIPASALGAFQLRSAAILPAQPGETRRRALVSGRAHGDAGAGTPAYGRIWELSTSTAGMQLIGTATLAEAPEAAIIGLMVDDQGATLAGTNDLAWILVRGPERARFEVDKSIRRALNLSPLLNVDTRSFASTGIPSAPHLVGTGDGHVLKGRANSSIAWSVIYQTGLEAHAHIEAMAVRSCGDVHEAYAAPREKPMVHGRIEPGQEDLVPLELGPTIPLRRCAGSDGGFSGTITALALDKDAVYFSTSACSAVVRARLRDRSARALTLGDTPIDETPRIETMIQSDWGEVLVIGDEGAVFSFSVGSRCP
ncbi:MAG: hypothetical protein IT384_02775 [Deltaproteobacteria bacterium]|nr:hypothetical protein [Deltaproteobacteria bacterium]